MIAEGQTAYKHESADELINNYYRKKNMEDNKFYAYVWSLAATVLIALCCAVTYINYNDTLAVERMVKDGVDPVAARCAVSSDSRGLCATYATAQLLR